MKPGFWIDYREKTGREAQPGRRRAMMENQGISDAQRRSRAQATVAKKKGENIDEKRTVGSEAREIKPCQGYFFPDRG